MTKKPHPVDVYVGSRVRLQRIILGMSQEKLGEQLGLTFQQVQKYEKGANRIGASRLYEIAKIFGVPVSFFFEGLQDENASNNGFAENPSHDFVSEALTSPEGVQLLRNFYSIKESKVRRKLIDLLAVIGDAE
jgi:transcriptional regulator with XRE-family HTH domain